MLIRKALGLGEVALKMEGDGGTFEGYASRWGGVDSHGDTILRGAFVDSLRANGQPLLLLEHSWARGGALLPIGKAQCEEDDIGLYLRGELTPGLSIASDVHAAMKHGTVDGLSIGGFVRKEDYSATSTGRVIKRWHHLKEVSVVSAPSDASARIDLATVKSIDFEALLPECKSERDIERLLRDAGLGKWEAMALVSRAKAIFTGRDAPEDVEAKSMAALLDRLERLGEKIPSA